MTQPTEVSAEWTREYRQDGDSLSTAAQHLVIKSRDAGGGPYYIIETERWAFDSIAELSAMLTRAGVPAENAKS
jgi:hypothetical protein